MNLQDQVTSLELSKRLKDLGVEQQSLFYWIKRIDKLETIRVAGIIYINDLMALKMSTPDEYDMCSAFTASELLEKLPDMFKIGERCYFISMNCDKQIYYEDSPKTNEIYVSEDDDNPVEAMGKMIIHLLQRDK